MSADAMKADIEAALRGIIAAHMERERGVFDHQLAVASTVDGLVSRHHVEALWAGFKQRLTQTVLASVRTALAGVPEDRRARLLDAVQAELLAIASTPLRLPSEPRR